MSLKHIFKGILSFLDVTASVPPKRSSPYGAGRPERYRPHAKKGKTPPSAPGEYRVISKGNKKVYIGETNNLLRRMLEHLRTGNIQKGEVFDYLQADGRSSSSTRREHERKAIKKHTPGRNKSGGGEGRKAKK